MFHSRFTRTSSCAWLVAASTGAAVSAQPCVPDWTPGFDVSGLQGTVSTLRVVDLDGAGPEAPVLVAGGLFRNTWPGGQIRNYIARWDGVSWEPFGPGLGGDVIDAVMFDDDGPGPRPPELIACGRFDSNGAFSKGYIGRWDGTNWPSLNDGMDNLVRGLSVFDEDGSGPLNARLFAGGDFADAGGVPARGIAAWDGVSWSEVGGGVDDHIHDLVIYDADGDGPGEPVLVVVGQFTVAGAVSASNIATWDGSQWAPLGAGLDGHVFAVHAWDPDGSGPKQPLLVAGGLITTAGGTAARNIAFWDGLQWSAMGEGVQGEVMSIGDFDPDGPGPAQADLFVGGLFQRAGTVTAKSIARWTGDMWLPVGDGASHHIKALAVFDVDGNGPGKEKLFVGGRFTKLEEKWVRHVGTWDGEEWATLGHGMDQSVMDLVVYDFDGLGPERPSLVAGGTFTTSAGVVTNGLAAWKDKRWTPLGQGLGTGSFVRAMVARPDRSESTVIPELYIAGRMFDASARTHGLIRYARGRWQSLMLGDDGIQTMAFFDPDGAGPEVEQLFVGGSFTSIGGVPANYIAMFEQRTWKPLGVGVGGSSRQVRDLLVHDDGSGAALYVAGSFINPGGLVGGSLARWRNGQWSTIGIPDSAVNALVEFDPDGGGPVPTRLIAVGNFTNIGGVNSPRVAMWDGTRWNSMGSGLLGGNGDAAVVIDHDGDGPRPGILYVTGSFNRTGNGEPISGLARWDGVEWRDMGGQTRAEVLVEYNDSPSTTGPPAMYAGGSMRFFGVPTSYIGRFGCNSNACYADCDVSTGVGVLDIFDFLCFQNSFVNSQPYACDCDTSTGVGVCDIFDFLCFQNAFVTGCT